MVKKIITNKLKHDEIIKAESKNLNFFYADGTQALNGVSLPVYENKITALIGPSGCGKSTFLRCFNRMHDLYPGNRYDGQIILQPDNTNILLTDVDPIEVRMRISMVFQKPNPFPKSIFDNVAYGPKIHGLAEDRGHMKQIVQEALERAGLWSEVHNRLDDPGTGLSGGQQQRLCIARAIAVSPEIILMDEPCSALDPIATARIEHLIHELSSEYSIVIVTHSLQQAARVSKRTAYFHLGRLVEVGLTDRLFIKPQHEMTNNYITGRFG